MTHADPALVFLEGNIQHPMQTILNTPMGSNRMGNQGGISLQATDVVGELVRLLIPKGAIPLPSQSSLTPSISGAWINSELG